MPAAFVKDKISAASVPLASSPANGTIANNFPAAQAILRSTRTHPVAIAGLQRQVARLEGVLNSTVEDELGVASDSKPGGPPEGSSAMFTGD